MGNGNLNLEPSYLVSYIILTIYNSFYYAFAYTLFNLKPNKVTIDKKL